MERKENFHTAAKIQECLKIYDVFDGKEHISKRTVISHVSRRTRVFTASMFARAVFEPSATNKTLINGSPPLWCAMQNAEFNPLTRVSVLKAQNRDFSSTFETFSYAPLAACWATLRLFSFFSAAIREK